ncbi:hypothetical protein GALMADRAFT_146270 [Galerina marginata CBS 339.88]|uniref:Uncharacterized protein n=1 Tax=Galerina marginata (strain CBS 339.88) TaxID=685588 RepID=A0A067SLN8_GALM3|nr:hypothetical protein GALMADRAFT_146270 [Galerina marginata CBS 339.88]
MNGVDSKDGSPYITNFDLVPPSPTRSNQHLHDLDLELDPVFLPASYDPQDPSNHNPLSHQNLNQHQHSPSYPNSYYNSPYSQHSELSFTGEEINFDLLSDIAGGMENYEPSDYDAPSVAPGGGAGPAGGSLLMFTQDSDYMSPHFSPDASGEHRTRGSPFDHSSPSSNGDPGDMGNALMNSTTFENPYTNNNNTNDGGRQSHSRASSVASPHHSPQHSPSPQPNAFHPHPHPQPHPSPRLDVAHSFGNMSVHTPNWGTQPLPAHPHSHTPSPNIRGHSPLPAQKPMSPPRLRMPEGILDGQAGGVGMGLGLGLGLDHQTQQQQQHQQHQQQQQQTMVPTINAPDGGADDNMTGAPHFHIVPATPVSGGADGHPNVPFQQTLSTLTQGASFLSLSL